MSKNKGSKVIKPKFREAHMKVAEIYAGLSSAKRLQVGCVIVKENRIISIGYNGMPAGWNNVCEDEVVTRYETHTDTTLVTKPEVLHAETNAIAKLARTHESGEDAVVFVTHAPCMECAKLIYQTGISAVYYKHNYKTDNGIQFLKKSGVQVSQI